MLGRSSLAGDNGRIESVLSLKKDSRGSSVNWKRGDGASAGGISDSKIVSGQQKRDRSPMQARQQGQRGAVWRESISKAMCWRWKARSS